MIICDFFRVSIHFFEIICYNKKNDYTAPGTTPGAPSDRLSGGYMSYTVKYFCVCHVGNRRSMNQDNYICCGRYRNTDDEKTESVAFGAASSEDAPLIGVFDGMGGEERGEVASLIASEVASRTKFGKDPAKELYSFCREANLKICDFAEKNSLSSTGTTAAMLVFAKDDIFLCNIGDSKIFKYSNGSLDQISFDHVASGDFGKKPPLTQNLGIPENEMIIEPYISKGSYGDGDVYLICSDGLTDMVQTDEIKEIVGRDDVASAAKALLVRALENGGRDNTTVILCKVFEN